MSKTSHTIFLSILSFNGNKDGHKIGFRNILGNPSIPLEVDIKMAFKGIKTSKKSLLLPMLNSLKIFD